MDEEKIEELVEEKVEEKLDERIEQKTSGDIKDTETGLERLVDQKITDEYRDRKKLREKEVSRRSFMKIIGLGAGGLSLASLASSASLLSGTTINSNTVWHAGNDGSGSGLNADTIDGKNSSELGSVDTTSSNPSQNVYLRADTSGNIFFKKTNKTTYYNYEAQYTTVYITVLSTVTKGTGVVHPSTSGAIDVDVVFNTTDAVNTTHFEFLDTNAAASNTFTRTQYGTYSNLSYMYISDRGDDGAYLETLTLHGPGGNVTISLT